LIVTVAKHLWLPRLQQQNAASKARISRYTAPLFKFQLVAPLAFVFLCWMAITIADWATRSPLPVEPRRFGGSKDDPIYDGKRIGLALSGGGYRAALMGAGILEALEDAHMPVQTITSVSGGVAVVVDGKMRTYG
jgi:Lysophospholipase catalytic domain